MTRLATRFDVAGFYQRIRAEGRPAAWCSAFAPVEILIAHGVRPVFPENHAAMLGAVEDADGRPFSTRALAAGRALGLKGLCSYAYADLGVLAGGAPSPIGGLPPPDLFVACDSQCRVVERWGEAVRDLLGRQGRTVPHLVLRAARRPGDESRFHKELLDFSAKVQAATGRPCDETALARACAETTAADRLWHACLDQAHGADAPWTDADAWAAMAAVVLARGTGEATAFYRDLLVELQQRRAAGAASLPGARHRLLFDGIPPWPARRWLVDHLAARGAVIAASTYTRSWSLRPEGDDPWAALAGAYAWNTMSRPDAEVQAWAMDLARAAGCRGVIAHRVRSCGEWTRSVRSRLDGLRAAGWAVALIEGDTVDTAALDRVQAAAALDVLIAELERSP